MLTSIENALLEQLDPQLGTANQNAGSEATDAVAGVDGGNVTTVS